jgi:transposase-like protein
MALDESAMSELLVALRAGGGLDVVREALALVLQALIEAEATEAIGAGRYERSASRITHRNGSRSRCCRPRPATWSSRSPSCARDRSSRRCWPRAAALTGRCSRWS